MVNRRDDLVANLLHLAASSSEAAAHIVALEEAIDEIEATDPVIGGRSWRAVIEEALEKWRGLVENGGCHVIAGGQAVEVTEGEAAVVVGVLEELLRAE